MDINLVAIAQPVIVGVVVVRVGTLVAFLEIRQPVRVSVGGAVHDVHLDFQARGLVEPGVGGQHVVVALALDGPAAVAAGVDVGGDGAAIGARGDTPHARALEARRAAGHGRGQVLDLRVVPIHVQAGAAGGAVQLEHAQAFVAGLGVQVHPVGLAHRDPDLAQVAAVGHGVAEVIEPVPADDVGDGVHLLQQVEVVVPRVVVGAIRVQVADHVAGARAIGLDVETSLGTRRGVVGFTGIARRGGRRTPVKPGVQQGGGDVGVGGERRWVEEDGHVHFDRERGREHAAGVLIHAVLGRRHVVVEGRPTLEVHLDHRIVPRLSTFRHEVERCIGFVGLGEVTRVELPDVRPQAPAGVDGIEHRDVPPADVLVVQELDRVGASDGWGEDIARAQQIEEAPRGGADHQLARSGPLDLLDRGVHDLHIGFGACLHGLRETQLVRALGESAGGRQQQGSGCQRRGDAPRRACPAPRRACPAPRRACPAPGRG